MNAGANGGGADAIDVANKNILKVGDTFDSYIELELKIKQLELLDMNSLSILDCKTIETAQKRSDRALNPDLKYYQVKYCCING